MGKKFTLPKKINIGGLQYTVLYPYEFEDSDILGMQEMSKLEIKISNTVDGCVASELKKVETFIHEIVHAIDIVFLTGILSEGSVNLLAKCIVMFFKENDINLTNDVIPDKIKILNTKFNIVYPYKFNDIEACVQINATAGVLLLDPTDVHMFRLKHGLLEMCLKYIIKVSNCSDEFEKSELSLRAFTTGMYQVFVDNPKLGELINEWC